MQQPLLQYEPVGHVPPLPHAAPPSGHVVEPLHDGGSVLGSWPGHSTQVAPPHAVLPHIEFCVHCLHLVGSPSVCGVQSGETAGLTSIV